jgi:hypothetical protein
MTYGFIRRMSPEIIVVKLQTFILPIASAMPSA